MKEKSKTVKRTVEKKRKRKKEKNADVETYSTLNIEVDSRMQVGEKKKEKSEINKKRKNKDKNLVGRLRPKHEADLEEKIECVATDCSFEAQAIQGCKEHVDADIGAAIKPCRSKKNKKKRKKEESLEKEGVQKSPEKGRGPDHDEIYVISSGDEDCSKGMKKWIMEYHESRQGLNVLQQKIDDFITAHEEKLEEERREREARAAEGGWTVVVHQKGRKKTTDSESGVAVGSVAQAAVENKLAKKKHKEVGLDFYRFQKKEAQRNGKTTIYAMFSYFFIVKTFSVEAISQ
ncbi:uncharacterized protein LOC133289108 [Gastrolobium bilobum]|uniref:uncharacterized protein LOC133289108 n=1 Tax=Gastrolobium bilobum TaxID=150636 RepID=UPI002AB0EA97|nr:uncharacterized protein LOC133289108 [Gastrolobium bilobum]